METWQETYYQWKFYLEFAGTLLGLFTLTVMSLFLCWQGVLNWLNRPCKKTY